jgi:hypothetical protein
MKQSENKSQGLKGCGTARKGKKARLTLPHLDRQGNLKRGYIKHKGKIMWVGESDHDK